ncbi:delta-adaptin [Striga asiatica]|uniref:Delta-adaptin n=1 Tax=Striga asiatica TaxID=4170 RepID=A0A5A7P228_STRAF|nr:delta-adaptin [Striga asiatica]
MSASNYTTMALSLDTIFPNKNPALFPTHFSRSPNRFPLPFPDSKTQSPGCRRFFPTQPSRLPVAKIHAFYGESSPQVAGDGGGNLDAFLSALEFLSLASSAAVSVYFAVRWVVQKGAGDLGFLGGRVAMWQCVVLVTGLAAGAAIRRRQWRRVCGGVGSSRSSSTYGDSNLLERVERLEEDLRGSATIVQALARRLEKLGIRFRVTRKALKEPIAETAALVQKNSEATRVLAAQEDILEKELGEIQKVLLAMQEQQQKQLELILAIGKAGKLWETDRVKSQHQKASESTNSSPVDSVANLEIDQIESRALQEETSNDRP